MAEGLSVNTCQAFLSAMLQGLSFVIANPWMQLHVGAPGADGEGNPAEQTARIDITDCFGTDPDDTVNIFNDAEIGPWPDAPADEDYTHVTVWTAETGGTFICSGQITADAVTTGDPFSIPAGECSLTIPPAS